ncbi:MAG: hypothetical protein SFX73_21195 [Kofleriaceae bacterium]|nr:hypothetical protein [Kofleriaceae bacterium]
MAQHLQQPRFGDFDGNGLTDVLATHARIFDDLLRVDACPPAPLTWFQVTRRRDDAEAVNSVAATSPTDLGPGGRHVCFTFDRRTQGHPDAQ